MRHLGWTVRIAVATVITAAGLSASVPASAAAPREGYVEILNTESFDAGTGTFQASGGGLCPSGTTALIRQQITERRNMFTFDVDKVFTCDDGSGTFVVHILARWSPCDPADRGTWSVVSGTGAYADLSGHGQLVGTYYPGPCDEAVGIVDALRGMVALN
ncbi:hypothetical protein [Kribbella swartbergensis]